MRFRWRPATLQLTLLLLTAAAGVLAAPHSHEPNIQVKVSLARIGQADFALDIKFTNAGKEALSVYSADLPWSTQDSILLIPVEARNSGAVLQQRRAIADPEYRKVTIRPGASLTGRIDLRTRILELPELLRRTDLLLFWAYSLQTADGAQAPVVHGSIFIPKQTERSGSGP